MSGFWAMFAGVLSVAVTFAIVEWIARNPAEGRLFFIALGRERTAEDEARVARTRIVNAICAIVAIGGFLAPVGPILKLIATTGGTTVTLLWLMVEMFGVVKSVKLERVPSRYWVSLDEPPKAREYVSMPLQVANVLVIVVPMVVFLAMLGSLPEAIPMQYGTSGQVSRMGPPSELWALAPFMIFDLLLLWGIAYGIAQERWALPEEGVERYVELQMERRRLMVRMIEWIMLLINSSMAFAWIAIALGSLVGGDLVGPLTGIVVVLACVGSLVPLVVYLPRLLKVSEELREIAGTEVLGTRPSGWRWGGLVYYAPEDPALFVPKRIGIGQTLNFARPAAWVLLIGVVVIPIVISIWVAAAAG